MPFAEGVWAPGSVWGAARHQAQAVGAVRGSLCGASWSVGSRVSRGAGTLHGSTVDSKADAGRALLCFCPESPGKPTSPFSKFVGHQLRLRGSSRYGEDRRIEGSCFY